ncbi:MAG: purine/pyrimidine permease [Burkholderiales bacterium]|nr:purine/pyrimidine permease [Burkholderiales bacterium]
MRKPASLSYGVDDTPPLAVNVLSGLQHVGMMSIYLIYPAIVAQAAGGSAEVAVAMISMSLIALAVGTALQTIRIGPFGSGYLCQPIPSVVYFVPSLVAAKHAGLHAVFAMTIAAGLVEMALARALGRLRALFPAEIAGLVVLLVGLATGVVGLRTALGTGERAGPVTSTDAGLALLTLAIMAALNVWGSRALRLFCVLIGMVVGCVVAWMLGRLGDSQLAAIAAVPMFALPTVSHVGFAFDPTLALPFLVAAVAATLKVIGNVTTCQKTNDADWVRADMRSISRGVAGDGLGSLVAGALGAHGLNSSTGAVGLATATGVTSRRVAYPVAAILLVLAFVPKLGILFHAMPRPVAGAALVFSATFIIINGLEIMASRLLDARKTLVIGLALVFGFAVEVMPGLLDALPPAARTALGTSIVLGTLVGLGLTLIFRIGLRRTATMTVSPGKVNTKALEDFLDAHGAAWGARRDVIERAKFNLAQSIETLTSSGVANGALEAEASFDEFNLDVRVSYDGPPLELPQQRPSNDEIMASEEGERRLAGFMLRRLADRVSVSRKGTRSIVLFHFDH